MNCRKRLTGNTLHWLEHVINKIYNVTFRRFGETIVAVERQKVLHV
jgi:hypothetical protein